MVRPGDIVTEHPTHNAEFDAILAMLSEAGMVEVYANDEGKEAYRLTAEGKEVAKQMALSSEDDLPGIG